MTSCILSRLELSKTRKVNNIYQVISIIMLILSILFNYFLHATLLYWKKTYVKLWRLLIRTQQAQQRWINVENWLLRWTTKIQRCFNVTISTLNLQVESTLILRSGNNVENSNVVSTLNIQPSQSKGDELLKGGYLKLLG